MNFTAAFRPAWRPLAAALAALFFAGCFNSTLAENVMTPPSLPSTPGGAAAPAVRLPLIPQPRELTLTGAPGAQPCLLATEGLILAVSASPEDLETANLLAAEIKACFHRVWRVEISAPGDPLPSEQPDAPCARILLREREAAADDPELFREQGYWLEINPTGVYIEAPTATGRFYGAQTLRQLLRAAPAPQLPALAIRDWPALRWRGLSDDISRGQVSDIEDFLAILNDLAYYKKNLYQPYIEDMFEFEANPNIGRARGALTRGEMARMVEEARRLHITLAPVFECLGHQDRLLSLPDTRRYAEIQDPTREPWSFAPVSPEAFEFVTRLVDEMVEVSTPNAPFFHIGGDESWDVGEGLSKARVAEVGKGRVHAEYFTQLHDYIQEKHHRGVLLYSDMLLHNPEALEILPKDCGIVDWHYHVADDYPSLRQIMDAGFQQVFASPGLWSWAVFYPNYRLGFENVRVFSAVTKREGAAGSITSSWGDSGAENLRENNWPGYAWSAACEWQADEPGVDEFLEWFTVAHFGAEAPALARAIRAVGWIEGMDSHYPARPFHRTPRLRRAEPAYFEALLRAEPAMTAARAAIAAERPRLRFHTGQVDPLDHAARRFLYLVRRDRLFDSLARSLQPGGATFADLPEPQRAAALAELEALRDELTDITREFSRLWLRHRKFPVLGFNTQRLESQIAALQDFRIRAINGDLAAPPAPWGAWFWYPDENPLLNTPAGTCYFIRDFDLASAPALARLKVWADDWAAVYVNGERMTRASYGNDPRNISIAHKLKPGVNRIAIEAANDYGAAAILLEVTWRGEDGQERRLTADDRWLASRKPDGDWLTAPAGAEGWVPVKILGHGLMPPWDFIDW